jgi:hypothetical protein
MNVTRDVILDLLPLYLSDEASPDTRALVDEHLEHDPDLARLADLSRARLTAPPPPPVNPDAQALAYREARQRLFNRAITLGIVVSVGAFVLGALALLGLMFVFPS